MQHPGVPARPPAKQLMGTAALLIKCFTPAGGGGEGGQSKQRPSRKSPCMTALYKQDDIHNLTHGTA